jgi:D-galactose 1-dehydrogenase
MGIRIAIVGLGRIARQSHIPALRRSADFELVAAVDPTGAAGDLNLPLFPDCETLFRNLGRELDAVAICTPPQHRTQLTVQCAAEKLHVLLEKPPAMSLGEAKSLVELSHQQNATIYFSWHSATNTAVDMAQDFLQRATPWCFDAIWRENPQTWHAGQDWIWQPGGMGVFDAGINALSILTTISDARWLVEKAELRYREQHHTPVAAWLWLRSGNGNAGRLTLDWDTELPQCWDIRISSPRGELVLKEGGTILEGTLQYAQDKEGEYDRVYRKFHQLICQGQSEMDYEPLRIMADAFLLGSRVTNVGNLVPRGLRIPQ